MPTSLPSAKALMTHADDLRHIVYASWVVPKFFPYMRGLLCVLYLNVLCHPRVVFRSETITQKRPHKTAQAGDLCAQPHGPLVRPAEQYRLRLPQTHRKSPQRIQIIWRNWHVDRKQQGVDRCLRRDDLLHPRDRLSVRGADVRPDEDGPSGSNLPAQIRGLQSPHVSSSSLAVIRDRARRGSWSLLLRMFG